MRLAGPIHIGFDGDDFDAPENEDGVRVLRQDFEIPPGALPVRMQTGDLPVTIVGWIESAEALPGLLRSIADETEKTLRERASED